MAKQPYMLYTCLMDDSDFEWDEIKNVSNKEKHGVSFYEAQHAFLDPDRVIAEDVAHSEEEQRYYCFGLNQQKNGVLTVRFTQG